MDDFHSIPLSFGSGGMAPKTFASLPPPLQETHNATHSADIVGEEGSGIDRLIAKPYSERTHKVAKPEPTVAHTKTEESEEESVYSLKIGTGAKFRRTGRAGLDRKLGHLAIHDKTSFAGINEKDRKLLGDIIAKHAKSVTVGSGLGYTVRREMKESAHAAWKEGTISREDKEKFIKIIEEIH